MMTNLDPLAVNNCTLYKHPNENDPLYVSRGAVILIKRESIKTKHN
jgi:hypothetical protein